LSVELSVVTEMVDCSTLHSGTGSGQTPVMCDDPSLTLTQNRDVHSCHWNCLWWLRR